MTGEGRQQALQEHIATMRTAPLSLTLPQGIQQAVKLRRLGLSWGDVGRVIGEYHGQYQSETFWRRHAQQHGAPLGRAPFRSGR